MSWISRLLGIDTLIKTNSALSEEVSLLREQHKTLLESLLQANRDSREDYHKQIDWLTSSIAGRPIYSKDVNQFPVPASAAAPDHTQLADVLTQATGNANAYNQAMAELYKQAQAQLAENELGTLDTFDNFETVQ